MAGNRLISGIVPAALICALATAADPPTFQIAGRSIRLELMRVSDRALVSWPGGSTRLATEKVTITSDTNIPERMAASGIMPDSGAFSLLYQLNPGLKLDTAPPGTTIIVPVIVAAPELKPLLADGSHYVVLIVDPDLRKHVVDAAAKLADAVSKHAPLIAGTGVAKQADDLATWFDYIRKMTQMRKGPPSSKETLIELTDEALTLTAILQSVTSASQAINADDARQIAAIHADVERDIKRYDDVMGGGTPEPEPPPCCVIEASIVGADSKTLQKVRVYYTLDGLFSLNRPPARVKEFGDFGSGKSDRLPAKSYRVWVSPDGNPNERLTNGAVLVELDPAEPTTKIQLRLAQLPRAH